MLLLRLRVFVVSRKDMFRVWDVNEKAWIQDSQKIFKGNATYELIGDSGQIFVRTEAGEFSVWDTNEKAWVGDAQRKFQDNVSRLVEGKNGQIGSGLLLA